MKDIVKFTDGQTLPASPDDLLEGLQRVTANLQGSAGGVPFLRLLRSGVFAYGAENIEPEPGSRWAVNPYSIEHGFACWGDGELLSQSMRPFNQPAPLRSELADYGHDWDQQFSMQLQCVNGDDAGTVVLYKGTSTGLRNASKKLIDAIIAQGQRDKQHIVPIIELEVDSYNHKKYGEIYFPVLNITQWVAFDTGEPAQAEAQEELPFEGEEVPADIAEKHHAEHGTAHITSNPRAERRQRAQLSPEEPSGDTVNIVTGQRRRRRRAS